jgi:hypothetical protein
LKPKYLLEKEIEYIIASITANKILLSEVEDYIVDDKDKILINDALIKLEQALKDLREI